MNNTRYNRASAWDNAVVRWTKGTKGAKGPGARGWTTRDGLVLVPRKDGLLLATIDLYGSEEFLPYAGSVLREVVEMGLKKDFVEEALVARDRWLENLR